MAPSTKDSTLAVAAVDEDDYFDFERLWKDIANWFSRTAHGINDETKAHPYYISFALLVVFAWPHILLLPFWFGKDAFRRVDSHARELGGRIAGVEQPRQRKRDMIKSYYQSIVDARYDSQPAASGSGSRSGRAPLFGGTPLTSGEFAMEEDEDLHIGLRIVRWTALAFAAIILGREWFRVLSTY